MKFVNLGSDPAARIRHNLISRGKNAIKNNHLPRNNPLHVKTNTNICPRRALKTNIGLPLAAHGNATVFCEQAREIFLVWAEVEMESLWNSWAGKKLPAEFFRIQGRRNFRRGEIKNFKQEKTEKTSGHTSGWSLVVWYFLQHEACGEQDLSAVWISGHLLWLESGCLVLRANMKHVENKTCLLSGHFLWLESGCLVLGANMKHVENKTCLLSGHFLWLESGCLVLRANMKHVENKTCLLSGHLDICSGWSLGVWCWVPIIIC